MSETDLQLLARYDRQNAEDAFAEIVRRHLNLVYSAALRQVRSPQLAEEVSQCVFVDLTRNAGKLKSDTVLTAWLYQVTRRTAIDVVRRESRRQLREQIAVEITDMNSTASDWTQIEPLLDEAMATLDQTDRTAILLRYFENKSLREVGQTFGTSDDAAQKRVSRAVERLREFFSKRGVAVGASGLAVVVSANAVQAAPVGLAATISTAATLAGTAVQTSVTFTAAKTFAMTTFQKSLITVIIAAAVGAGIYQSRQNSTLRSEIQTIGQQHAALAQENQRLAREHDNATNQLALMREENVRLKSGTNLNELARLRGKVGLLQDKANAADTMNNASGFAKMMRDPAMKEYIHQAQLNLVKTRYSALARELKLTSEQTDTFFQAIADSYAHGSDKLFSAEPDKGDLSELTEAFKGVKGDLDAKLQSLLGDQGASRFKEYSEEVPARSTVEFLEAQLGAQKLSDEQHRRLFETVKAEPFELTHGISGDFDKAFWGSQEEVDRYVQRIAESNQRVLQKAREFLEANQLAALTAVLSNGITSRVTQAAALVKKR